MLAEADETFTVTIAAASLPSGVELGTTTATGTIEDDEVLVASVTAGSPTVAEGGTASFAVALTGGKSTAPVAIEYTVTGTATVGVDYTAPAGTLTLNAGLAEGTILIAVLGDEVLDPGETLIVELTGVSTAAGAAEVDATKATTTITGHRHGDGVGGGDGGIDGDRGPGGGVRGDADERGGDGH